MTSRRRHAAESGGRNGADLDPDEGAIAVERLGVDVDEPSSGSLPARTLTIPRLAHARNGPSGTSAADLAQRRDPYLRKPRVDPRSGIARISLVCNFAEEA
jgi:hypothetical protein